MRQHGCMTLLVLLLVAITPDVSSADVTIEQIDTLAPDPSEFSVGQNHPNPFTEVTRISFQVPKSSGMDFHIYTVTGQKVESVFEERLEPGYYEITWFVPQTTASGIFFYKIVVGEQYTTKKMVLIK